MAKRKHKSRRSKRSSEKKHRDKSHKYQLTGFEVDKKGYNDFAFCQLSVGIMRLIMFCKICFVNS